MKLSIRRNDKNFFCFIHLSKATVKFFTIFYGHEPKQIEDIQKLHDDGYAVNFKENLLELIDMFDGSYTCFKTVAEIEVENILDCQSKALEVIKELVKNNPEEFI